MVRFIGMMLTFLKTQASGWSTRIHIWRKEHFKRKRGEAFGEKPSSEDAAFDVSPVAESVGRNDFGAYVAIIADLE